MRAQEGTLEVYGAGQLDVLSVGRGHLKLTITEGDAIEVAKAKRVITDMLARGFAIFVENPDGTTSRVKAFNAKRFEYLIDDTMDTVPASEAEPLAGTAKPKAKGKRPLKAVPVAKSKATGVGRMAGG